MSTASNDSAGAMDNFDNPPLAPEEHAWVEECVGRKLTTREAQDALREAKLVGSWAWEHRKREARP